MLRLIPIALFCVAVSIAAKPPQLSIPASKPPQATVDIDATYKRALASESFLIWAGDVPQLATNFQFDENQKLPITISGPWHEGRHVTYEALQTPTRKQVEAALEKARATWKEEVAGSVTGKSWPPPSTRHDGDGLEAGPLPEGFDIAGMKRYKRASMTQEIFVLESGGRDYDKIIPKSRLDLHARDNRWLVSGGLLGIAGFRSDLYRNDTAANSREYVGDISVLNSLGYHQNNRGWRREFADGSKFLDVLSAGGEVFEIRQRLKESGKWRNSVIFTDEAARPKGYTGLTVACVSCHNAKDGAGTGPYAGPLVLGSDQTFSYPFAALEK